MSEILTVESGNVREALDMDKAREVANTLFRHYPGYLWAVHVHGGILTVEIPGLIYMTRTFEGAGSNPHEWHRFKYAIKHADSYSSSDLANEAMRAGGELLERAGLPRGRMMMQ